MQDYGVNLICVEAEIIRIIYDKFVNTTMGMAAIAAFLNNSGYKKKLRQNNTIEGFSTSFVNGVLDNPIYCGKVALGRRKNEKILNGTGKLEIVHIHENPTLFLVHFARLTKKGRNGRLKLV